MSSRKYTVFLRDTDLTRLGEIDQYTQIELRLIHAGISSWIIDLPADLDIVQYIAYGRGIIIRRDDNIVISGPIDYIEHNWDANNNTFRIAGPDDTVYLQDKLALPVTNGPPYTSQAYDVRTGVASTIMRQYVDYNVGPNALAARRRLGLVLETPDPLIGAEVTGRARFDTLTTLLQSLAMAGGDLGFRVVQSETDPELIFQVFQPEDKTGEVIFSPDLQNLKAFRYVTQAAEANYFVTGGSGEGTARTFYEAGDANSIALLDRRIEQFRDRRDTSSIDELTQTTEEELAAKASKSSLSITPIDTDNLSFMDDYRLGDKVRVVANGAKRGSTIPPSVTIEDVIREIRLTVYQDRGEEILPSVGTPESGRADIFNILSRIDRIGTRTGNLERR